MQEAITSESVDKSVVENGCGNDMSSTHLQSSRCTVVEGCSVDVSS